MQEILAGEGFHEAPALPPSGVYVLLDKGVVEYVGQSSNLYQRLTSHYNAKLRGYRKRTKGVVTSLSALSPRDVRVMAIPFDQVLVKFIPEDQLDEIERVYITRYKPRFNLGAPRLASPRPPKIDIDIRQLASLAGIESWKKNLAESSSGFKRRRVA